MKRLTNCDPAIRQAAIWLAEQRLPLEAAAAQLPGSFLLSPRDADLACELARSFLVFRKAHG